MSTEQKDMAFPFTLDHKPGFFLGGLLYRLFQRVQFDQNVASDLKQMHRDGAIVYAIKYRGFLDYLLYHFRFRRGRLPYPKIAFDLNLALFLPLGQLYRITRFYLRSLLKHGKLPSPYQSGYFRESIQAGTPALLSLVDPVGFMRRFIHAESDPLHFLIDTQRETEKPIYIVPQLVLYQTSPEKEELGLRDIFFGFKDKPGTVRKTVLFFRYNRRAFIDFGPPLNLKEYLQPQPDSRSVEDMALEIRQILIDRIDAQKRVVLGPVMKSRQQLKEIVLKDAEVLRSIENAAGGNPKHLKQQRKKAGSCFDEIAADYNIAYVQFFNLALAWLWKKIFEGVDVSQADLARLRSWARRGPLIYIPSHKSHIDYLVLNQVLYQHHMHVPRVAAGKNLAFWPMGHVFRKSGAFFIRRSFRGMQLYPRIFSRYVKALLQEGHPLEFFIEGGRSRSGKVVFPKAGLLSFVLDAYQEGYCQDLVFVPASISYDRIMEEGAYLREVRGGAKEKESFRQMFGARRFLGRKYGKVYIRLAEPISLREYLGRRGQGARESQQPLAFDLVRAINRVTMVTPLALVSTAILAKHRRGFYLSELAATAHDLITFLDQEGAIRAASLDQLEETVESTLSQLVTDKVVEYLDDVEGSETYYYVEDEKKRELEYYKNSILHFFIQPALVAVTLHKAGAAGCTREELLADYGFLRELFQFEFVFPEKEDLGGEVDRALTYLLSVDLVARAAENGRLQVTARGMEDLRLWTGLAKTFLESYWVASRAYLHLKSKESKKPDFLKHMNYLGQRFHKQGLIDHLEAVSQINFGNAARYIQDRSLKAGREAQGAGDAGVLEMLSGLTQRITDFVRVA